MGDGLDLLVKGPAYVIAHSLVTIAVCSPLLLIIIVIENFIRIPPHSSLESIYIPALDRYVNSTTTTLTFSINIENRNPSQGLLFDPINVTFYDYPIDQLHSIGNFTIPSYHHGHNREKQKGGTLDIAEFDTNKAIHEIITNGFTVLRMDVATTLRFKYVWKSGTHTYKVGADIKIGDTGTEVHHKKNTRLVKSGAAEIRSTFGQIGFLVVFLLFLFGY